MEKQNLEFELMPHKGIGPILLGSSRSQARETLSAIGFPFESSRGSLDYFCEASIQVEYGADDKVWFIGVSAHERFIVRYQGKNVFELSANNFFALVAASESSGPHTFTTCEYCFPDQIITLWDADEQYDHFGSESKQIWAQVGIGNRAYASAIAAIRDKV